MLKQASLLKEPYKNRFFISTCYTKLSIHKNMSEKFFLSLLLFFVLTGCSSTLHTRGNLIDLDNLKKIRIKETTQAEVHEILGPPSTQTLFTSNGWYYIGEQASTQSFLSPKLLERHIVLIEFDENDKVSSLKKVEKSGYDISPDANKTPIYGRDPSVLSEVFGNIGRYSDAHKQKK